MPTSREISGYFDREYFELHPGKRKYLEYLAGLLRASGVRAGRVLDIGAGYGFWLETLARNGYAAVGLELAPAAARVSVARSSVPVVVGSAESPFPFADASFDAITLLDVIEHLEQFDETLASCRQALAPGGSLFVITLNAGSLARPLLGRGWSFHLDPTHVHLFSARRLRTALRNAGMKDIRLSTISNFCSVGESNTALKPLRRIGRVVTTPWFGDSLLAVARR